MFQREECDAHFAFANVAKSTQRCVSTTMMCFIRVLLVEDLFLSSLLEHKKGKSERERTLVNAKKNLHAKARHL